jgi:DNA-binding NarL/FixJ family response regulator
MKVLLVDDHPLILSALQTLIHTLDEGIAVATADNPQDAFAILQADDQIELVLLDLSLGEAVDGFAVLEEMRGLYPALPVVVVSASERLTDMVRAIDLGAMGFVPKRSSNQVLFDALALVLSGGVYIPPALLGLVRLPGIRLADAAAEADAAADARHAEGLANHAIGVRSGDTAVMRPLPDAVVATAPVATAPPVPAAGSALLNFTSLGLTPRQCEVLGLLLKGLPNKLIARELNVSVDTVKDHVAAVLRALGASTRTQAVLMVSRMSQPQQDPALVRHSQV